MVRAAGSLAVFVLAGLGLRWPQVSAAAAAVPAAAAMVSIKFNMETKMLVFFVCGEAQAK